MSSNNVNGMLLRGESKAQSARRRDPGVAYIRTKPITRRLDHRGAYSRTKPKQGAESLAAVERGSFSGGFLVATMSRSLTYSTKTND
jgi:hypothetical protein